MDKRAEIIRDEGSFERFVGPIERASRIGFSGFRDVGGKRPIEGRRRGGIEVDSGAGSCARSTPKGVQTDKTAITAKQETGLGANRGE